MSREVSAKDRFLSKIKVVGDCWEWQANTHRGYGRFQLEGVWAKAHRAAYRLFVDPTFPLKRGSGLSLLHNCNNTICVNPKHLRPGTHLENLGETHKLTDNEELEVTLLWLSGVSQTEIAARYKCSQSNISYVVRGVNSKGTTRWQGK